VNRRQYVSGASDIPRFDRQFFDGRETFTRIGSGGLGGKASGLAFMHKVLASHFEAGMFRNVAVNIPNLTVLTTDVFDAFIEQNRLEDIALSDEPDERIAAAFQNGAIPAAVVGDLRALVAKIHQPVAVRSSSLLEDAMFEPFAGIYATKMIPNNQADADTRFKKLTEAIKFVYASTYLSAARSYAAMTSRTISEEKMAVIIQEVVGQRSQDRFYPAVSGVARSYNFYPVGRAEPEDGIVSLALGLGKTIVDGGKCWSYSPVYPSVDPPFTIADQLEQTQTDFWAVNMGKPPAFDPLRETEYLVRCRLADAEMDDTLRHVASTYVAQDDRIVMGTAADGPRIINFRPILQLGEIPVNDLVRELLEQSEKAVGTKVEIEFALTVDSRSDTPVRFGFLQVRPMVVSHEVVDVAETELSADGVLIASSRVMGNGCFETIHDVVYVRPERFSARRTPLIARELEKLNRRLVAEGRPYLLIGFGRWGSTDPWLGTPVNWAQISGAKVIVEATLPEMNVELSQGSHFFHNITSFRICYFSVRHDGEHSIDWSWLNGRPTFTETDNVRHVRLSSPLKVRVDGRHGRGVVFS